MMISIYCVTARQRRGPVVAPKDGGPGTLGRKLGEANSPLVLHVGFAAEAEAAPAEADSEAVRGSESESAAGHGDAAACRAGMTLVSLI